MREAFRRMSVSYKGDGFAEVDSVGVFNDRVDVQQQFRQRQTEISLKKLEAPKPDDDIASDAQAEEGAF